MPFLPVDTAIQVIVGPLVDDTDFKSLETGVAYNAAGMSVDLIKKGTNSSSKTDITPTTASTQDWVELGNGMYSLEITAAQNDTEGTLQVVGVITGILPFASPAYVVVPTQVYNSLVAGTDALQVDTIQISGTTQTANDVGDDANSILGLVNTIGVDTGATMPVLLPTALVGGKMDCNVGAISASTTAADRLEASALGITTGSCEATPSTTSIQTDLAETTDSFYNNRVIVFTSGAASGQARVINSYTGSTGTIGVTALEVAPSASDTFVIV